ncbi:hypothetical protein FDUTEX481_07237 [Tolypothrix sp. PCC 7601]|nr:hypothetical protein FDUTEX481_07237 [Tolypothrix sp. PCC 7601]
MFSASKIPFHLLKKPYRLLILVFSASKKLYCLLIWVNRGLILVFSASILQKLA